MAPPAAKKQIAAPVNYQQSMVIDRIPGSSSTCFKTELALFDLFDAKQNCIIDSNYSEFRAVNAIVPDTTVCFYNALTQTSM